MERSTAGPTREERQPTREEPPRSRRDSQPIEEQGNSAQSVG